MFKAFQAIRSLSSRAAGYRRQVGKKTASTTFSDSSNRVIKVSFKAGGKRGNGYVANLYKINATKFRFRLWAPNGTRLNTITKEDASPPSTVMAQLVDAINANETFKKYINVKFINESTEAFSASTDIGDGQRITGGK